MVKLSEAAVAAIEKYLNMGGRCEILLKVEEQGEPPKPRIAVFRQTKKKIK